MSTDFIESEWRVILKIGAAAAFASTFCSIVTLGVTFSVGGEPQTPLEYLTFLQEDKLKALLRMDFASVINTAALYFLYFALFGVLKRIHLPFSALALVLLFVGMTLWLGTHSGFSWLVLSSKFAETTSDVFRLQLLTAGEAILASDMWKGTGGVVGGILSEIGALILSVLMLKSKIFGKPLSYIGIVTHSFDLTHALVGVFSASFGAIFMMVAGPLYLLWLPWLGVRLLQLARPTNGK